MRENLEYTACRELEEETGVKGIVMEQIATYGDYDRDLRSRVGSLKLPCFAIFFVIE